MRWHRLTAGEALERLSSSEDGIDAEEADRRRERFGPNRLRRARPTPWWRLLLDQLTSVVVLLLVGAALVSVAIGEWVEAVAIAGVLVINAAVGFTVELRARRTMETLLAFEAPTARVRRPEGAAAVGAEALVPGDVVEVEEGDAVPADGRLVKTTGLRVDEAPLTGESVPVDKSVAPVDEAAPLAERSPMVYSGTTVVAGRGVVVVTATGSDTEVGRIGLLLAETEAGTTPLQERLDSLGRRLVGLTVGVGALAAVAGIARGAPVGLMIETGIALAIAAVPEGLPAVATVALAVGLRRMARRNALVRRLDAVEALGSTTVVCTDKTGTLTAGRMTVSKVAVAGTTLRVTGRGYSADGAFLDGETRVEPVAVPGLPELLETCALTNRATLAGGEAEGEGMTGEGGTAGPVVLGDPTDAALLVLAWKGGLEVETLTDRLPRVGEVPFDTDLRLSASIHDHGGRQVAHVKGAPEAILGRSRRRVAADGEVELDEETRARLAALNREMADEGLRVIALARGKKGSRTEPEAEADRDGYPGLDQLTFLGLVGIVDPPADGVAETIETLRNAGVDTVMVTGDQRSTAEAIADALGTRADRVESLEGSEISALSDHELAARSRRVGVYSRVSPRDKVRIVAALQTHGDVVAMIGDGVNDAAALKRADVGVAMGGRGTDVAKEAAAIVLSDDRFRTIGAAVQEGRVVYDNIRKFVYYLFSCNLAEVATIVGASLVGAPVPLLPLQILWLNLVTDTFPALALALEPAESDVMERDPRDVEASILSAAFVRSMAFFSLLITLSTLAAFWWGLASGTSQRAVTLAFMTLALAQLFHLGNARSRGSVLAPSRIVANPWAVASVPLVLALQVLAVYWPPLARLLGTAPLALSDWGVVLALAAIPAVVGQGLRHMRGRRQAG